METTKHAGWTRRGEIVTDGRRRISLGRMVPSVQPGQRYRVEMDDYGRVLLSPMVAVPVR